MLLATLVLGSEVSEYEAMVVADDQFVKEAEEATRSAGANWDYTSERNSLQALLGEMAAGTKKLVDVELKAASQQSTAMQYLQMQQQQIQQMQMQVSVGVWGEEEGGVVGFSFCFGRLARRRFGSSEELRGATSEFRLGNPSSPLNNPSQ